jgi:hypothetical protein
MIKNRHKKKKKMSSETPTKDIQAPGEASDPTENFSKTIFLNVFFCLREF